MTVNRASIPIEQWATCRFCRADVDKLCCVWSNPQADNARLDPYCNWDHAAKDAERELERAEKRAREVPAPADTPLFGVRRGGYTGTDPEAEWASWVGTDPTQCHVRDEHPAVLQPGHALTRYDDPRTMVTRYACQCGLPFGEITHEAMVRSIDAASAWLTSIDQAWRVHINMATATND